MVARLPTPTPSSMGYFYSPQLARTMRRAACAASASISSSSTARRWRSTSSTCAASPRSSTSATWIRRSGSSTRSYKPFPLSLGYWLEGAEARARGAAARAAFDLCTATTRAEWETLEGYGTGARDRLVPERRRQRVLRADRRALRSRHDLLRRPHGLLPEPGVHVRLLRDDAAAACRRSGPALKLADRRRRSVAGGARARRAAGRHRDRLGARRAAVPAARRR